MSASLRHAAVGALLASLLTVLAAASLSLAYGYIVHEEGKNYVVYYAYNLVAKILWRDRQILRPNRGGSGLEPSRGYTGRHED